MSNFPTLDGLNNIDADSTSSTNITCETFIATTSAQAPTMTAGSSDNNVATTQFVTDAITNAPYVTTDTTQTLTTGTKYFTNLPQCATLATTANQLTNKSYVDSAVSGGGSAVLIAGTQTLTAGIKTFTNLPESSATPSTANQLVPKTYVDTNFVALTGAQTITGSKDFNASTTTIRGTLLDVYPTTTQLYSTTTNIAGTTLYVNSTTNTIQGTTTNITTPAINLSGTTATISGTNCNITSPATNLSGTITTLSSPTINVTGTALNISSPTTTISGTNTNFTGTNTSLTGTIATATTQSSSDNSTKLATTAFVNSYATANYMTLTGNQNVSGVKTYSTKQIFNAGTASSTYDNTSLTDMTIASNSTQGILSIAGGRITTDTFGVRAGLGGNLQLNEGAFIQPNSTLAYGSTPVFTFGLNQSTGYVDIPAVPRSAEATKRIDTGLIGFFCGNNQSTLFTITHSIVTTSSSGIGTMNEAEVYFYFVDNNTGITRYTTGNLATTTGFTLLPNSTYVRPTITFSLTTDTLPEGSYKIYGYSRVTNAYSLNAGFLSVNWNLSSPISSYAVTQDYNTPKDYTFTSRNLYHNFRNYVAGVYHVNVIAGQQNIVTPIFYSITYYINIFSQALQTGALTTPAVTGGSVVGSWGALSINNSENVYIVYPNYSIIVYNTQGWTGTIYLNFKNTTNNPVVVAPTTISAGSSCKIYFDEVELLPY